MGKYPRALLVETLDRPGKLLERRKYWRPQVAEAFFEEIAERISSKPDTTLELAAIGPEYVAKVHSTHSHAGKLLQLRAHLMLASAHRAVSNYNSAEKEFDNAFAIDLPDEDRGDLYRRRAYLLMHQSLGAQALASAQRAVQIFKLQDDLFDRHSLGLALETRGYVYHYSENEQEAAKDFSAALGLINHRTCPRAYYGAIHNLASLLMESADHDAVERIMKNLQAAYKRFIGNRKAHKAKFMLRWLQALALIRFGSDNQAEVYLKGARTGLLRLRSLRNVAIISLDLGLLYLQQSRFEDLDVLASETYSVLKNLGLQKEALAALHLWHEAQNGKVTETLLRSVRDRILPFAVPE